MDPQLRLDLECLVARLQQIQTTDRPALADFLFSRVLTCDLPRLEEHLRDDAGEATKSSFPTP